MVHPGEPKHEVREPGAHRDRLQVIVNIRFLIFIDFFRVYIKRWCTQENQSRR